MKAEFNRKELLKAINGVKLAVPSRLVLPVLRNIIVGVNKSKGTLTATNLNTVIKASIKCKSSDIGEVMLPAKEFKAFVEAVNDCENVTIELDGNEVQLKAGNHTVTLPTNTSDYPPIPTLKPSYSINILNLANQLKQIDWNMANQLKQIDWNMAVDYSSPVLGTVHFDGKTLAAADGFTLGIAPVKIEGESKPCDLMIPREAAMSIIKLRMNEVKFEFSEIPQLMRVTHGNIELTTHCVQGDYPDYNNVIPKSDSCSMTVDSKALLRSVKVMRIADSSPITKLESMPEGLKIWKESHEFYQCEMGIQSSVEAKGDLKVAISDQYLFNVLSRCKGNISISSTSISSPITIKNGDCTWVIMPMFVQW